jgi:hypothetical protein
MAPDVTAARGRLKDSLRLIPGPLADLRELGERLLARLG